FIYKLHPGEYERWKTTYPYLLRAKELGNFSVIDNNNINLYSYFSKSKYQVGVNSTAIFEGLTFGCKTILYNIIGVEYMKDLISKEIVAVVNSAEDFKVCLNGFKTNMFDESYFFK